MNPYKKDTANPYSFLVNDTTLASDNPLRFRRNRLKRIQKAIAINDKIRNEKAAAWYLLIEKQRKF